MNAMKQVRIDKLTLNVGAGTDQKKLKNGMKLLKNFTGIDPVKTVSDKRIPAWGIRPGLPVGCKITIRGKKAEELIHRMLAAKENKLKESNFDTHGNVAFGIHEYIDIPDLPYDSTIGIMGFQATITLERPGYRVKERRKMKRKIGKDHQVNQKDAIDFFKDKFNITIQGEE